MAKLILQAILFVTLLSALYGAPQNPTTPRNIAAPAIATLEAKQPNEKNAEHSSSEEAIIRPARTPDHDGTNHDHKDEHHHGTAKLDEHIDHGSSTTPKTRPARDTEEEKKHEHEHAHAHEHEHEHHAPATLTKEAHKQEATTSAKPRPARDAEEKKHDDSHQEAHPATLTKDHKDEATSAKPRTARTAEDKKHDDSHHEAHPATLSKDSKDHKDVATSTKPRTARAAEKDEKHEDSHGNTHPTSSTKDSQDHKNEASTGARPARATEKEIKGAVHDQPIPIPPTLKEENKNQETKHTEEKQETPKEKRDADKDSGSSEDNVEDEHPTGSPFNYIKSLTGQKEDHFALPNQESEYDRHVRQTNDDHHSHITHREPEHSHLLTDTQKQDDSSSSSSSEEHKSKSS